MLDVDKLKSQWQRYTPKTKTKTPRLFLKSEIKFISSGSLFISLWGFTLGHNEFPSGIVQAQKAMQDAKNICLLFGGEILSLFSPSSAGELSWFKCEHPYLTH